MERNLRQELLLRRRRREDVDGRDIGERINDMRTDQAIATGADTIAVGCPFCLTMMSDGIKDRKKEETMAALDVAEIVWRAMGLEEERPPADDSACPGDCCPFAFMASHVQCRSGRFFLSFDIDDR